MACRKGQGRSTYHRDLAPAALFGELCQLLLAVDMFLQKNVQRLDCLAYPVPAHSLVAPAVLQVFAVPGRFVAPLSVSTYTQRLSSRSCPRRPNPKLRSDFFHSLCSAVQNIDQISPRVFALGAFDSGRREKSFYATSFFAPSDILYHSCTTVFDENECFKMILYESI